MLTEVVTGDLLRALSLLNPKPGEAVRLAFPPGLGEVSIHRGWWETVAWAVESAAEGPTVTVAADELHDAADRPMCTPIETIEGGRVRVADTELDAVARVIDPPRMTAGLEGVDASLPPAGANPYAPTLVDIGDGAAKAWLPAALVARLRLRGVHRVRLFTTRGHWYASAVQLEESHLVRVAGRVGVY
jgi:hypothetical protein